MRWILTMSVLAACGTAGRQLPPERQAPQQPARPTHAEQARAQPVEHFWFCEPRGYCYATNEKCSRSDGNGTAKCVVMRDAWCNEIEARKDSQRFELCFSAMWQCADTLSMLRDTGGVITRATCRGFTAADGVPVPVITAAATAPAPASSVPDGVTFEDGIRVIAVDHPFWCSKADVATLCASTLEICQASMGRMKTKSGPCLEAKAAACYMETGRVTGQRRGWCFDKLSTCRTLRDMDAADPEERDVTECVVMRQQP